MLVIDRPSQQVPFGLIFAEKLDPALYQEAIKDCRKVASTYNPETQTSDLSIYAGTTLTYDESYSGFFYNTDDNKQTDT